MISSSGQVGPIIRGGDYVNGKDIDKYWGNAVRIRGKLHRISGAEKGKHSGTDYIKFSVRTETLDIRNGCHRPNYIVCRAYDAAIRGRLGALLDGEILEVDGEAISSTGSGGLFVLVKAMRCGDCLVDGSKDAMGKNLFVEEE